MRWKALIDVKQQNNERKEENVKRLLFLTVLCTGIVMFLAGPVCAKVTGLCADCHTMHNSQNGLDVDADGPYRHLTIGDCVGCHTGINSTGGTSTGATPFVYHTSEPTYDTDTLAGGNFYWVAQTGGDAKGHNVLGLSLQDVNIPAGTGPGQGAPGGPTTQHSCANSCHSTLAEEQTSIGEFGSGCEGCHLEVAHHKGGSATVYADAEDGWFRFCAGHLTGAGMGVVGLEDDDWQYTKGATDHNEYLGNEGAHDVAAGFNILGNTMTAYCCGCHGNFHIQDDNGAWVRHPSDVVLPADVNKEYQFYTVYDPIAPVARDTAPTSVSGVVTPGTDMVMCLSCHRAHGTPFDDILRWDYSTMVAGGGGSGGCFVCHTTKDDI